MSDENRMDRILKSIETIFDRKHEQLYSHAFDLWIELCKPDQFTLEQEHKAFIFTHLLPTVLSKDANNQSAAIKAAKLTLPILLTSEYRSSAEYKKFLSSVITEYMPRLRADLEEIHDWAHIWCLFLMVCQKDVAKSIQINAFLAVAESGFRSPLIANRTKSFVCWRKLIEVFGSEGQLLYPKKIKLIIMPLTATPSKTPELASAKFDCWIYLINHISTDLCVDPHLCLIPYLLFCFGPIGDTPLLGHKQNLPATYPGKLYVEIRLPVVLALITLLGPPTLSIQALIKERKLPETRPSMDMVRCFPNCRSEIIYSCAEATILIYNVHNISLNQQAALTRNLWENLFALIDTEDQLLKAMVLVLESVQALIQLLNTSSPAHKMAIPIIMRSLAVSPLAKKSRGLDTITDYSVMVMRLLIAAHKLINNQILEENFNAIMLNFEKIVLNTNKLAFLNGLCAEVMKVPGSNNDFRIWTMVWQEFLVHAQEIPLKFLAYGLEEHFEQMLKIKERWVLNYDLKPNNWYLNEIAQIFGKVAAGKAASLNVVEVVLFMLEKIVPKFDHSSAPSHVLKLFTEQLKRFLFTEFVLLFLESLLSFLLSITGLQFTVILAEMTETLEILKSYGQFQSTCEIMDKLRKALQDKCALISNDKNKLCADFLKKNSAWIYGGKIVMVKVVPKKAVVVEEKKSPEKGDCVPIKRTWTFNPKELTEHQIERMKQRRDDIPALYNDDTQSQDSRSLKPWVPQAAAIAATAASVASPPATTTSAPEKAKIQVVPIKIPTAVGPKAQQTESPTPRQTASPKPQQTEPSVVVAAKTSLAKTPTPASTEGKATTTSKPEMVKQEASAAKAKKQQKKKGADWELSRLAIDTVEGNPFGKLEDDGGLTTRKRRSIVLNKTASAANDGKENEDQGVSPKKKDDKEKQTKTATKLATPTPPPTRKRRARVSTTTGSKSNRQQDGDESVSGRESESDSGATSTSESIPAKVTAKPNAQAQPVEPVVVKKQEAKKLPEAKKPEPMVSIPFEIAPENEEKKDGRGELNKQAVSSSNKQATNPIAVMETEQMTENLPVVVEDPPILPTSTTITPVIIIPTSGASKVVPIAELGEEMEVEEQINPEEAGEVDLMLDYATGVLSTTAQRSILSSPELENVEQRESTFLNDTINISPILKNAAAEVSPDKLLKGSESNAVVIAPVEPKTPEIMTTPKRNMDSMGPKESSTAVSTTPHPLFLSKMNGRGAQMLQQTKLFQESTPKEKIKEEMQQQQQSKEEAIQRLLIRSGNPSCKSSPSTSILRRKRLEDSMDETMESPAAKKKKVSFSDPPVSATKEYERDMDSKKHLRPLLFKSKLNRLLIRKSRTDSASEIRELSITENGGSGYQSDSSDSDLECEVASSGVGSEVPVKEEAEMDDSKIFEYLQKKYTESGDNPDAPRLAVSQSRILTKILLQNVANNEPTRDMFFHALMYAMPKDALKWALQENSGYTNLAAVTEQVSSATFNNFVISKLKTDGELTKQMFRDMQLRLDAVQKLKLIQMLSSEPTDSPSGST